MTARKGNKNGIFRFYLPKDAWIITLTSAIWGIGSFMYSPFQSIFFKALGMPLLYIAVMAAISSVVTAIALLLGGYLADVFGRRKVIVIFSTISAGSAFLYLFINTWQFILVPVIIGSLCSIYTPAFNSILTESMRQDMRPSGFASFAMLNTLPAVFAPVIGGLLMVNYGDISGLKIAFFASGMLGLTAMLYRSVKLGETYKPKPRLKEPFLKNFRSMISDYAYTIKKANSDAKKLLWYTITSSIAASFTTIFISIYLVKQLSLSPITYGLLSGITGLATVIVLIPSVRIIKRAGLKKATILAALFSPLSMFIFVSSNGMNDLLAWSVTGGVGGAIAQPSMSTLQGNLSEKEQRGKLMALFSVMPLIAAFPAQIFSGYLYANVSYLSTFMLAIPFYVISVLILMSLNIK
jgi:MFS family permease